MSSCGFNTKCSWFFTIDLKCTSSFRTQILISVSMELDRFFIKEKCLEGMSAFTHIHNSVKSQLDSSSAWHMSDLLASAMTSVAGTAATLRCHSLKNMHSEAETT